MNTIVLKNGMTVMLDHIPNCHSSSIGFFVKAGSVDENKNNYGIAHVIEHMLFKGTKTKNYVEISRFFDSIGADFNAYTHYEETCYHAKVLNENLEAVISIFHDMLINSIFSEDELIKEKNVILEEIKMYEDSNTSKLINKAWNIMLFDTEFEHDVVGTAKTVKSLTKSDLLDFYNKFYIPSNMVVCISGGFNEDEVIHLLEKLFITTSFFKNTRNLSNLTYTPVRKHISKKTEQSHVVMACHTFNGNDKNKYALNILSYLLGDSMSSKLFKNIRDDKGLAYSIYSNVFFTSSNGIFYIYGGVSNKNVNLFIDSVFEELTNLKKTITKEEFNIAKTGFKTSNIFSSENNDKRMKKLGENKLRYNSDMSIDETIEEIMNVTYEDVVNLVDILTDTSIYSIVVLSNTNPFKKED